MDTNQVTIRLLEGERSETEEPGRAGLGCPSAGSRGRAAVLSEVLREDLQEGTGSMRRFSTEEDERYGLVDIVCCVSYAEVAGQGAVRIVGPLEEKGIRRPHQGK